MRWQDKFTPGADRQVLASEGNADGVGAEQCEAQEDSPNCDPVARCCHILQGVEQAERARLVGELLRNLTQRFATLLARHKFHHERTAGRSYAATRLLYRTDSTSAPLADSPTVVPNAASSSLAWEALDYDDKDRLGSGAFGDVYRGLLHGVLPVAIKVLKGEALEEVARGELARESQFLASLRHANCVRFLGVSHSPGSLAAPRLALVTEFMSGGALRPGHNKLTLERIVWALHDVAKGLAYLHRLGVVHRDVKPANVRWEAGEEGTRGERKNLVSLRRALNSLANTGIDRPALHTLQDHGLWRLGMEINARAMHGGYLLVHVAGNDATRSQRSTHGCL